MRYGDRRLVRGLAYWGDVREGYELEVFRGDEPHDRRQIELELFRLGGSRRRILGSNPT